MTPGIILVSLIFMGLGMLVQYRLKSKFAEYGKVPNSSGLSGKEVAEKAIKAGIDKVVFDRNGYLYHGRVKSLADSARESGLKF